MQKSRNGQRIINLVGMVESKINLCYDRSVPKRLTHLFLLNIRLLSLKKIGGVRKNRSLNFYKKNGLFYTLQSKLSVYNFEWTD